MIHNNYNNTGLHSEQVSKGNTEDKLVEKWMNNFWKKALRISSNKIHTDDFYWKYKVINSFQKTSYISW